VQVDQDIAADGDTQFEVNLPSLMDCGWGRRTLADYSRRRRAAKTIELMQVAPNDCWAGQTKGAQGWTGAEPMTNGRRSPARMLEAKIENAETNRGVETAQDTT
jgi:hypothetical protein